MRASARSNAARGWRYGIRHVEPSELTDAMDAAARRGRERLYLLLVNGLHHEDEVRRGKDLGGELPRPMTREVDAALRHEGDRDGVSSPSHQRAETRRRDRAPPARRELRAHERLRHGAPADVAHAHDQDSVEHHIIWRAQSAAIRGISQSAPG